MIVSGHSLGGGLASGVAHIFNCSAVTFGAPGDLLFLRQTGLMDPAVKIHHYGFDADSTLTGTCYVQAPISSCPNEQFLASLSHSRL
jgi:putative lipase involved disintegration of autophagic bodies